MGGKGGGSVVVGYRYYASIHMALCHGPVDKITKITIDEKQAWTSLNQGQGSIYINRPDLFGGEGREGGIVGGIDFEFGGPNQQPNGELQRNLGTPLIPAFRGVVCAMLKDMYLGINPYLKKWWFRAQRIHVRTNGQPQWYDRKSEIRLDIPLGSSMLEGDWDLYGDSPDSPKDTQYVDKAKSTNQRTVMTFVSNKPRVSIKMRVAGYIEGNGYEGGTKGPGNVYYDGKPSNGNYNSYFLDVSSPKRRYYLNDFGGTKPPEEVDYTFDVVADNGATLVFGWDDNDGRMIGYHQSLRMLVDGNTLDVGMNPAHIIRECFTDQDWGMGYPEADIDEESFKQAADKLYNEGLGICILWDQQAKLIEFVGDILRHIDASVYVDRNTGKFVLKLVRDELDPPESEMLHLNEDVVDKVTNFKRGTIGELINSVTITYSDITVGQDRSVTISDIALTQQQGFVNTTALDFKGFPTHQIASMIAQRELKQLSTPLYMCTLYATTEADVLNIGDAFFLSWEDYAIRRVRFRVIGIAYGDGQSNRVRVECIQDNFESPVQGVVGDQVPEWQDPSAPPDPITNFKAYEALYYEAVLNEGQDVVDAMLKNDNSVGFLSMVAERVRNAQKADYMVDVYDGKGYTTQGSVHFSPSFVLKNKIEALENRFEVADIQQNSDQLPPYWGFINNEIIQVTEIENGFASVIRGCLDTIPRLHPPNSVFIAVGGFSNVYEKQMIDGDVVLTYPRARGFSSVNLDVVEGQQVTFSSRAARPYLPGRYSVNGELLPDVIYENIDNITVKVAHRNKYQQTAERLLGFLDNSISPPQGLTYEIELYEISKTNKEFVKAYSFPATQDTFNFNPFDNYEPPQGTSHLQIKFKSKLDDLESLEEYTTLISLLSPPTDLKATYHKLEVPTNFTLTEVIQ